MKHLRPDMEIRELIKVGYLLTSQELRMSNNNRTTINKVHDQNCHVKINKFILIEQTSHSVMRDVLYSLII